VWDNLGVGLGGASSTTLANESKQRFAILSSEMALALSSPILQPASTTGHSGFDFDLEAGYAAVHPGAVGSATFGSGQPQLDPWKGRAMTPHELFLPSFHVRKALPFSFEMGGRMTYVSQSSYFAVQGEAKWALNEGFDYIPDIAVRVAHTRLFGENDWKLDATDVDFLISKRWGVMGVTSFTPYGAARFTFVGASSNRLDFGPYRATGATTPVDVAATQARFPNLRAGFYRTTAGLRMTAYAVSVALEVTYFAGSTYSGKENPDAGEYPRFSLASSWAMGSKFGWEF
jgi:hypothetical protein